MNKVFFSLLLFSQLLVAKDEPLVVGTTSGYAPYVSLNEKGQYEGFDIDFAEALASKLNRKLVIKDCGSMPSLFLALQQKKVDALIWAISIKKERKQKMDMIYYQGQKATKTPFLFWKTIPEGIESIEDLDGVVCVEAGSYQEGILMKYPKIKTKQVEKITDALMEIRSGKSKVAMTDPDLVARLVQQFPEIKVVELPLAPEDYYQGNGVCIQKTNQELAQKIREATAQLIADGTVARLEKKWGLGND